MEPSRPSLSARLGRGMWASESGAVGLGEGCVGRGPSWAAFHPCDPAKCYYPSILWIGNLTDPRTSSSSDTGAPHKGLEEPSLVIRESV